MKYPKKSLGQNFLIDKNITYKIINLLNLSNKNIIEVGPGRGALTSEILKRKPKSIILIEKDKDLAKNLANNYINNKKIIILKKYFLKFDLNSLKSKFIIIGNLPYNISSQILLKIIREDNFAQKFNDLIFMFQKELGERIIGKFQSKNYGRLSIVSNYKLNVINKFLVSPNCFFPKPKVNSMVIHFKPKKRKNKIQNFKNLEKITQILFSNRRKMINKNLKKILTERKIKQIPNLKINHRPENLSPELYYKIAELYESG